MVDGFLRPLGSAERHRCEIVSLAGSLSMIDRSESFIPIVELAAEHTTSGKALCPTLTDSRRYPPNARRSGRRNGYVPGTVP